MYCLNNKASEILRLYLASKKVYYQLASPGIHRRNSTKRAIRMFKNHIVVGLCGTDTELPLHLCDCLLPQSLLTPKLLKALRVNPNPPMSNCTEL